MSDPSDLPQPFLNPKLYPDYMDAQKKQMLVQMLMGNMQQSTQTPSDWNSMRVVPRRGMISNLATLGDALLAGKGLQSSQAAQQNYLQKYYGTGDQSAQTSPSQPIQAQPPAVDPNEQSVQPVIARNGQSFQQAIGGGQQPTPGRNPLIPPGMSRETASQLMGLMGPQKYGEAIVAPNFKPAEIRAQIQAAGYDPDSRQGMAIALAAMRKATTNVQDVRPGGTLFDLGNGQPVFSAPQNGAQITWGPGGPTQNVVPGAPAATAAITGAETAGKTSNTPQVFPTAGGGSTVAYPSDALGTPPALRTPMPAGPPVSTPNPGQPPIMAQPASGEQAPPAAASTPAPPPSVPRSYFPAAKQSPPAPTDPNDPWSSLPKMSVSNSLGAPDEFTKGVLQAAGKKHAELIDKYGQEADLADQKFQYNAQALQALPSASVGPLSEWLTHSRSALIEAGIPASVLPNGESVTPTLELNKYLKNTALQGARSIYGTRMTQTEVKLQTDEMSPSAHMTADAISSLIQQDNIKSAYSKQRAEAYAKYHDMGGDPLRFESWYSSKFPLQKFAQQYVAQTGVNGQPQAGPQNPSGVQRQPSAAPTITSRQQYTALPPGSSFIGSDGKRYRKPQAGATGAY